MWLGLVGTRDCLLFFNLAEAVVCFLLVVGLAVITDFFCVVSLVEAIEFFLFMGFDVTGAFLSLGLVLTVVVEFFFVCCG